MPWALGGARNEAAGWLDPIPHNAFLLTHIQHQSLPSAAGGYIGLKYLVAARQDLAADLLPACLPSLLKGLQDSDDDVRAASADALVPLAEALTCAGTEVGAARVTPPSEWCTDKNKPSCH